MRGFQPLTRGLAVRALAGPGALFVADDGGAAGCTSRLIEIKPPASCWP
jgi:hypothetical protein